MEVSRPNEPDADHGQPVAVEVARIAHRHGRNLAVVHGAAEHLTAEGGVVPGGEAGVGSVAEGSASNKRRRIAPEIISGRGFKSSERVAFQ